MPNSQETGRGGGSDPKDDEGPDSRGSDVNLVELRRGGATPRLGGWGGRWDRVEGLPRSRAERQGVCGWLFLKLKVPGRVVCSCAQPRRGRLGLCLRHEFSGIPRPKC